MTPLAIDLFCGLGGWTEGLLAEGYRVIGFDIERHQILMPEISDAVGDGLKGTNLVEKRGWTQGCAVSLGIEGANAKPRTRLIEYPAQLVLQDVLTLHGSQFKDAALIVASPPCQGYSYRAMPWSRAKALPPPDNTLFEAPFRIQREASEAAGHHIPLVVENVRGAQKWVGRARWNFGSFYLWGDVPTLMPIVKPRQVMKAGVTHRADGSTNFHGTKNNGGSLFAVAHNKTSGHSKNARDMLIAEARKCGGSWFGSGNDMSLMRQHSSKSNARKAASAMIAKIPFVLASHVARVWKPRELNI